MLKYKYCSMLVIGCVLLQACGARRIPLTDSEKMFTDSLAEALMGKVTIEHDFDVVDHNRKDKTVGLIINNAELLGICEQDSVYLKKLSVALAGKLYRILNYKSNYSHIEVWFQTSPAAEDSNTGRHCRKSVVVSTMPPYASYVSEWYNSDDYSKRKMDTVRSNEIIERHL